MKESQTATDPMKRPLAGKSLALAFALVLVAGIIGLLFFAPSSWRGGPELLRTRRSMPRVVSENDVKSIARGGYTYTLRAPDSYRPRGTMIPPHRVFRRPLRGGAEETLYTGIVINSQFGTDEIVLLEEEPGPPRLVNANVPDARRFQRNGREDFIIDSPYARQPGAATMALPGVRETLERVPERRSSPRYIVRIPFSDGKVTVTKVPIDPSSGLDWGQLQCLTPTGLFWVRPDTKVMDRIIPTDPKKPAHLEIEPHDTLMFQPFDGKPIIVRWDCLVRSITALPDAIQVEDAAPYPKTSGAAYRIPFDQPTQVQRLTLPKQTVNTDPYQVYSQWYGNRHSVKDRYYWLDGAHNLNTDDGSVELLSSRKDGTDVRAMPLHGFTFTPGMPTSVVTLLSHEERLFIVYSYVKQTKNEVPPKQYYYLAPIRLERPEEMVGEAELIAKTGGLSFQENVLPEDFFYFETGDMEAEMTDFLKEQASDKLVSRLYRVRLPKQQ